MTIPWLMNCAHSPDGWCLDCVKELAGERDLREKQLIKCQQQLIERNHELFLKNAAPQAPLDGGEKDTLAAHPGASSPVVAARRIWFAGVPPQGEPEPWDWIPHVEGADRQKEINAYLRKLVDDMPIAKKP